MKVHGRARERALIAELLDGLAGGAGGAVLLDGPAGIGKSTLLDEAASRAAASGARVLRARGYEAEADIPYAGLADLLRPVMEHRERLPDGQRRALEAALAIVPGAVPGDRYAVPVAVLALLGLVADDGPLLVAVDDGHWLDPASREAVLFVAGRLAAQGAAIVVAARDTDGRPIDPAGFERLTLGPLPRESALAVLADDAALAPDVAEALV
ncbi:MAG TPA: ATP-binding protein, partial [Capillimicrobium sp.]